MHDELPIMIEPMRTGYRATTPFYPKLNGQGRSQDEAVHALFAAIERQERRARPSTPLVSRVEINTRTK